MVPPVYRELKFSGPHVLSSCESTFLAHLGQLAAPSQPGQGDVSERGVIQRIATLSVGGWVCLSSLPHAECRMLPAILDSSAMRRKQKCCPIATRYQIPTTMSFTHSQAADSQPPATDSMHSWWQKYQRSNCATYLGCPRATGWLRTWTKLFAHCRGIKLKFCVLAW